MAGAGVGFTIQAEPAGGLGGGDPALGGSHQIAFLDEEGLVDILDGLDLLAHGHGQALEADRAAVEADEDGFENAVVHLVEAVLVEAGKGLVKGLDLFDLYTGPNVGPGRKSLAWHVLLQSETKTLGEKDMSKFLQRVEGVAASLGGELRSE